MFTGLGKSLGIVLAIGVTSELVYQLYRWTKRLRLTKTKSETESRVIAEVLFFPDRQIACKDFFSNPDGCDNPRCRFTHKPTSLSRLYGHLSGATVSLDVCVFVICCADLGDHLIDAHKRGVKVRVICDDEQIDISGSQIWRLRREGINVRTDNSSYLMHHKFAVVDKTILINGSFNWTRQAISGNQENLMVTNSAAIVSQYLAEYEKLWEEFDPSNYTTSNVHR